MNRREFLSRAAAAGAAKALHAAEAPALIEQKQGNFRFIRGIAPYSSGAVAMKGYEVVHATLHPAPPYRRGFDVIDRRLQQERRPSQALCGIELRSPRPLSFSGFGEFNQRYIELLKERSILVDGWNPVARTNVAPEVDPPEEVVLYGFSYTVPSAESAATFVVAGGGELTGARLDARDIVRRGDVSISGMREKAAHVLHLMEERLRTLGVDWPQATAVEIYTVQNLHPLMRDLLLPWLGAAKIHGIRWHFARPPIQELEFEMDVRGCRRELLL
jgi:hypothetical protein